MDRELDKRLKAIEKKLDALLKQTAPDRVKKDINDLLPKAPARKGYAGVPADDPRLRGGP